MTEATPCTDSSSSVKRIQGPNYELFAFHPTGKLAEYHLMIHAPNKKASFSEQLQTLQKTYLDVRNQHMPAAEAVIKRYFLSDAANQESEVYLTDLADCAFSVVQQPPTDGTKVGMWIYLMESEATRTLADGLYVVDHNAYRHLWIGSSTGDGANAELQTRRILQDYAVKLIENGCTMADNCVRTWFYVNDIDNQYAGMVKARNDFFMTQNLTPTTHYISSTGIGGRSTNPAVMTLFDAYAVKGLAKGQMHYVYALDHLNRTSEYGVSFERGTIVDYGDRRQLFLSGTASIDNHGAILFERDIKNQVHRMWENVEALLAEAKMGFNDLAQIIVYLRDNGDAELVKELFEQQFSTAMPIMIVLAPVCRPGWLIEMEAIAIQEQQDHRYQDF